MKSILKPAVYNLLFLALFIFTCKKNSHEENHEQQSEKFVANAGPDYTITLPMDSVTLAGSASGSDDKNLSYQWSKISSADSSTTIINDTSATASVRNFDSFLYMPTGGLSSSSYVYQFELKVTSKNGELAKDTVTITAVYPGMSVGGMEWKQSDNGLMFLHHPLDPSSNEYFLPYGAGAESFISDYFEYQLKLEDRPGWIKLKYVNEKDIATSQENVFLSSYIIYEDGQPLYCPAIYAKQNSGIDFSKKGIAVDALP